MTMEGEVCVKRLPISVSIPKADALKGIISSSVCYATNVAAFGLPNWDIQKPYEDYVALRKTLETCLVVRLPALPPTFWYGNADPNVVEERRQSLEKFMTEAVLVCAEKSGPQAEALWSFLEVPHAVLQVIRFLSCPETQQSKIVNLQELLLKLKSKQESCTAVLWHTTLLDSLLQMARDPELKPDARKALLKILTWQIKHGPDHWEVFVKRGGLEVLLDLGKANDECDVAEAITIAIKELLFVADPQRWTAVVTWLPELAERFNQLLASQSLVLHEGVASLLWATCASSENAATRFMQSANSSDRKTLLNGLFMSHSSVVKVCAGIFLSRLLPILESHDGRSVSQKTEDGLVHLLSDLCDPDGDKSWQQERLFTLRPWRECIAELLVSPCGSARTFALFVIKKTGNGEGLREYLAEALRGVQTAEERTAAAELLLSAWRDDLEHGSGEDIERISAALGDESYLKMNASTERLQSLHDYRNEQENRHETLMQHFSAMELPSMDQVQEAFKSQQETLVKLQEKLDEALESLHAVGCSVEEQRTTIAEIMSSSSNIATIWMEAAELLRRRNKAHDALQEINAAIAEHEKQLEARGEQRMNIEKTRSDKMNASKKIEETVKNLEKHAHQSRHFAYSVLPEMRTSLDQKITEIGNKLHRETPGSDDYRQWQRDLAALLGQLDTLKNPEDMEVEAKLAEEQIATLKEHQAALYQEIEELERQTRDIEPELEHASKPLPELRQKKKEYLASHEEVAQLWNETMLPHVAKEHKYFLDRWEGSLKSVRDNEQIERATKAVLAVDQQFVKEHEARQLLKSNCLSLISELQHLAASLGD